MVHHPSSALFSAYAIKFNEHPGSEVFPETGEVYGAHVSKGINICSRSRKKRKGVFDTAVFVYRVAAVMLPIIETETIKRATPSPKLCGGSI